MTTKRIPVSLSDHHGPWCAVCREYIARGLTGHHVLPKAYYRSRFGGDLDLAWTVPVHHECHSQLQQKSNSFGNYLDELLAGARTLDSRNQIATWFHERGYYWYAVLANLDTLHDPRIQLTETERNQRIAYILTSAAGVRGGQNIPWVLSPDPRVIAEPGVHLNLANLRSCRGHYRAAHESLDRGRQLVESLPKWQQQALEPTVQMRRTQIFRDMRDADRALRMAERDYSIDTASVLLGSIAIAGGNRDPAYEALQRLENRAGVLSWLFVAERHFMMGTLAALRADPYDVYRNLSYAQYICAMLGIQLTPHPDLPLAAGQRTGAWTPTKLLCSVMQVTEKRLCPSEEECLAIRNQHIGGRTLYEHLLEPMQGRGGAPVPEPGYPDEQRRLRSLSRERG